jgi:hypothetical protein
MTLKDLIENDFGIELPISGGFGNSIDNAIIIHRSGINDYVGTEHFILECLGKGRRIKWKILGQELLHHNNKMVDKIKLQTKEVTETELVTQMENYYFDITECFGINGQNEKTFNEEKTLREIKERIIRLADLNDFNKKCVLLLKNEKLFNDSELSTEFLEMILKDESLHLFESMMKNKRKPIMEVLRIIGKELNENQN